VARAPHPGRADPRRPDAVGVGHGAPRDGRRRARRVGRSAVGLGVRPVLVRDAPAHGLQRARARGLAPDAADLRGRVRRAREGSEHGSGRPVRRSARSVAPRRRPACTRSCSRSSGTTAT
jgi:hypothetical protein